MDTVVFPRAEVIDYFTTKAVLAKFNGPADDTALAREFGIKGYPTFVLLDKDGKEIDRLIGYFEPEDFLETIENYRAGIGTLDDLLVKSRDSQDRGRYLQIADKYKYRGSDDSALIWFAKVLEAGATVDTISAQARSSRADMHRRSKRYDIALAEWQAIGKDFVGTDLELESDIWVPIIYKLKGDTTTAIAHFNAFIVKYPADTEDVAYAKEQIDLLKGVNPNPEAKK